MNPFLIKILSCVPFMALDPIIRCLPPHWSMVLLISFTELCAKILNLFLHQQWSSPHHRQSAALFLSSVKRWLSWSTTSRWWLKSMVATCPAARASSCPQCKAVSFIPAKSHDNVAAPSSARASTYQSGAPAISWPSSLACSEACCFLLHLRPNLMLQF